MSLDPNKNLSEPADKSRQFGAAIIDGPARMHDLDALRAIAMLLGIVLHVSLSFTAIPWPVKDATQSDIFYYVFAGIHGFRMPLFFLLSGFFTAMMWRRRGLTRLVSNRLQRILLPLVIGCLTIVPTMWAVLFFVSASTNGSGKSSRLFDAVVADNIELVRAEIQNPETNLDDLDTSSGSSPLATAVFLGRTTIVKLLIDAGANIDLPNREQATPLHIAVFMGRAAEARMLIDSGANLDVRDGSGLTPEDLLTTDFQTTNFIASSFGVALDEAELIAGRREIATMLGSADFLGSPGAGANAQMVRQLAGLFFQLPLFMHLWFLWFLCWLLVMFVAYAWLASVIKIDYVLVRLVRLPWSLCWFIPMTMLPQAFMQPHSFGPDPSDGLLPVPWVLAYYAIFFFFGVFYWDSSHGGPAGDRPRDRVRNGRGGMGPWWIVSLVCALGIVFPLAMDFVSGKIAVLPVAEPPIPRALIGNFLQATYAWLMIFGSIGMFRAFRSRESWIWRYVSDSSYWLYLAHLPAVILGQWLVRDLQIPAVLKFLAVLVSVTMLLLLTYQLGVRHTMIGRLLNGKRTGQRSG